MKKMLPTNKMVDSLCAFFFLTQSHAHFLLRRESKGPTKAS